MQKPYSGFPQDFSEVASKFKVKSSTLYARLTLDVLQNKAETVDEPLVEMSKLPDSLSKLYAKQLEKHKASLDRVDQYMMMPLLHAERRVGLNLRH
ncbi:Serine/threonine-protein phosphatase 6 regulatory ankyrin repeat subunit B [Ophiocordyceps camponoti-floridani]|uniref:Serine/threonine-protein phosphatase 6 regulatory ankyrin repeat subunit B n=1 Tax=Ophiocordyceps camponoti-floridani TaxID=2030778 RepID=A0A8H4VCJ1_9HYPO|nr:Serine/threonine-protein phosphatase 6 regulatory ankyrin repeat subunit B [Ophiocordyceps camponoti-floridani]